MARTQLLREFLLFVFRQKRWWLLPLIFIIVALWLMIVVLEPAV